MEGSECSIDNDGVVCSKPQLLQEISERIGLNESNIVTIVNKLDKITNCDGSEKCALKRIKSFYALGPHLTQQIDKNISTEFKPESLAHNSTKLLSNYDIDNILTGLAERPQHKGFYPIKCQMIDFADHPIYDDSKHDLRNIDICKDIIQSGYTTMGVVFNTDIHSGGGIHWFAVFGDFRSHPYTIEYFNSSGHKPRKEILLWCSDVCARVRSTQKSITSIVASGNIAHQKSETECGVYSIHFIHKRLNNIPVKEFGTRPIPDELMYATRNELFAPRDTSS